MKTWIETNDDSCGTYNTNSQFKFKTSILSSGLCDYSDANILVKGTISIAAQAGDNLNNDNKKIVFKNSAPFTDYTRKISNIKIDNAKHIDLIMP